MECPDSNSHWEIARIVENPPRSYHEDTCNPNGDDWKFGWQRSLAQIGNFIWLRFENCRQKSIYECRLRAWIMYPNAPKYAIQLSNAIIASSVKTDKLLPVWMN